MQIYLRYCPICVKENIRHEWHSNIYVPGIEDSFLDEEFANTNCSEHNTQPLIKMLVTCEEFQILRQVSNDPSFILAMDKLKSEDIIEFNLKMSQFKTQVEQHKQSIDTRPKCPKCGSTAITTGSRGVNFTFGLIGASKTVNRCSNCGHTWKPKK